MPIHTSLATRSADTFLPFLTIPDRASSLRPDPRLPSLSAALSSDPFKSCRTLLYRSKPIRCIHISCLTVLLMSIPRRYERFHSCHCSTFLCEPLLDFRILCCQSIPIPSYVFQAIAAFPVHSYPWHSPALLPRQFNV